MGAVETLRDALFGNPPSPVMEPSREGVLSAFTEMQASIVAAVNEAVAYATVADLPVVSAADNGKRARVYDDPIASNNTYWVVKDGAWAIDVDYIAAIADVVQPLVDATEEASEIAVDASLASLRTMGSSGGNVAATLGSTTPNSSNTSAGAWSSGRALAKDGVVTRLACRLSADMVADLLLVDAGSRNVIAKADAVALSSLVDVPYPFGVIAAPAGALVWISRLSGGFVRSAAGYSLFVAADDYDVGETLPAYTKVEAGAVAIEFTVATSVKPVAQSVTKYDQGRMDEAAAAQRGARLRERTPSVTLASAGQASGGNFAKRCYGDGVLTSVKINVHGASSGLIEMWRDINGTFTKLQELPVEFTAAGEQTVAIPRWIMRGTTDIVYDRLSGAQVRYATGGMYHAYAEGNYGIGATVQPTVGNNLNILIGLTVEGAAGASPASLSLKRATMDKQLFAGVATPGAWSLAAPFSVNNGLLASGAGGWDKFAGFAQGSSLHRRRLSARFQINDTASIFGIASKPFGEIAVGGAVALIDGVAGELAIYSHDGTAAAGTRIAGTAFAAALVAGRSYTLEVIVNGLDITAVLRDCVTGTATSVNFRMAPTFGPNTNPTARFHGRPGIIHRAGDWRADWTHFELDAPRAQPFLIYGDSNTEVGGGATAIAATWGHQLVTAHAGGIISAVSGEESGYMAKTLSDLAALRVPLAICAHGTNDDNLAEWRSSVGDFVDACRDTNTEPVLVRPLPQPSKAALMTSMDADLTANYFGKWRTIDFLGALSNGGDRLTWNASYDNGDGVHANTAGHARMKLQAEIDVPELAV